jgi:hypothetical protein
MISKDARRAGFLCHTAIQRLTNRPRFSLTRAVKPPHMCRKHLYLQDKSEHQWDKIRLTLGDDRGSSAGNARASAPELNGYPLQEIIDLIDRLLPPNLPPGHPGAERESGQSIGQSTNSALRCLVWVPAKRKRRLQRCFEQKAAKVSKAIVLRRSEIFIAHRIPTAASSVIFTAQL